jgi:hypothetical protein
MRRGLWMFLSHVSKEGTSCTTHKDCCAGCKFHDSRHVLSVDSYVRHMVGCVRCIMEGSGSFVPCTRHIIVHLGDEKACEIQDI